LSFVSGRDARAILVVILTTLVLGACGGAATPAPSWPADAIVVTAVDRQFDTKELQINGEADTTLVLINRDSDAHNIAIRTRSGFDGEILFRFDPVSATTIVLHVGKLPKGSFFFLCDVHPTMSGTVFVY
jgi:plastocyanin